VDLVECSLPATAGTRLRTPATAVSASLRGLRTWTAAESPSLRCFVRRQKQTAELRQHSTKTLKSGTVNLLQSRHRKAQFCSRFQTIRARSSANWDSNGRE
jgi:hypothetical protein